MQNPDGTTAATSSINNRCRPRLYSGKIWRALHCSVKPSYGSPSTSSAKPRPLPQPANSPSLDPMTTWRRIWRFSSEPPGGRTGQKSVIQFLTRPAQQASQDLLAETARQYPALKQAILAYYGHNLAARAQRFHDWRFDVRGAVRTQIAQHGRLVKRWLMTGERPSIMDHSQHHPAAPAGCPEDIGPPPSKYSG